MTFVIHQKRSICRLKLIFDPFGGEKIQRRADGCSGRVAMMFWRVSVGDVVSQESKQFLLAQLLKVHNLCWDRPRAYLRGWYKRKRRWYQGQKTEVVLSELETIQGAINTQSHGHMSHSYTLKLNISTTKQAHDLECVKMCIAQCRRSKWVCISLRIYLKQGCQFIKVQNVGPVSSDDIKCQ